MSTLVTGGSGFIGRHVVDRLLESGERVVSYDRGPRATGLPAGRARVQGELFDLRAAGGHDRRARRAADRPRRRDVGPAALDRHADGDGRRQRQRDRAPARGRPPRRVRRPHRPAVLDAVYGHNDGLVDEQSPLRPRTPYAATKAFSDLLGQVYHCRLRTRHRLPAAQRGLRPGPHAAGRGTGHPRRRGRAPAAAARRPARTSRATRSTSTTSPARSSPRSTRPAGHRASTSSRAASASRSARWSRSCAIGSPTPTSSSARES